MNFFKRNKQKTRTIPVVRQGQASTELETYLEYYSQLKDPGYAVLITGAWGIGKTHQTKNAIGDNSFHISLFGLRTAEEVYSSVFAKMFPTRAKIKQGGRSIQEVGLELGGSKINVGGLASGVINALIREQVNNERILIFDDLERSSLPITDCLGVINKYVEHHGCRVVVIAHDAKLAEGFLEAKEKIFGHTISVIPQYESAFDSFIEKYSDNDEVYGYLLGSKKTLLDIVKKSECESLRVLKHTIEDLTRIYKSLEARHTSDSEKLLELTALFTALSLEARSGALKKEDILSRHHAATSYYLRTYAKDSNQIERPAIMKAADKYPAINLSSNLFSDELLIAMLFNGSFQEDLIRRSLNNSPGYSDAEELPPWRVLMSLDELHDSDVERAVDRLTNQFGNLEVTEPGEIMHLFAFRLFYAHVGLIGGTIESTVAECRKYLDALVAVGRMQPFIANARQPLDIGRSYGGYAYWVEDTYRAQFQELFNYLIGCGAQAMRSNYSAIAESLLALMTNDSSAFVEKLTASGSEDACYAYVDVLSAISPEEFVKTFMQSHPKHWRNISHALRCRYNTGELQNILRGEADWVIQVITLLEQERDKALPLCRVRLERVVPWQLKPMAQEALAVEAD